LVFYQWMLLITQRTILVMRWFFLVISPLDLHKLMA
jgi:hypothetical protein